MADASGLVCVCHARANLRLVRGPRNIFEYIVKRSPPWFVIPLPRLGPDVLLSRLDVEPRREVPWVISFLIRRFLRFDLYLVTSVLCPFVVANTAGLQHSL